MAGYLIWDFDDTLARRDGRWSGALVQAAATEGVTVDAAALKPYLREGFPWHLHENVRVGEAAGLGAVLVSKAHADARWFCEGLGGLVDVLEAEGRGSEG